MPAVKSSAPAEPTNTLYTVDGVSTPVPDDLDKLGPAMSQVGENIEIVAERNRAAAEQHKAETEAAEQAAEQKAQAAVAGELPKPSELLAQQAGMAAERPVAKSESKSSS